MRKAVLLYNPLSGPRRQRRHADVEAAAAVLREAGVQTVTEATRGQAEVAAQTRQAIANGCDTIFACGGDGTVHDVLQSLVGSDATLGVIPLGTANALAHDIGLPLNAVAAARSALAATSKRIGVGQVEFQGFKGNRGWRYFTVAAGVGVDAHLFYQLSPLLKSRLGMAAYYAKATHLWMTHPLLHFAVEVTGSPVASTAEVSQLLAVRIRNFGGVVRELAPGASLARNDLRLVLFRTRSRWAYLRYILRGLFAQPWAVRGIELHSGESVTCHTLTDSSHRDSRIFVEADGELLGTLPASITMVPDALNLLMP